MKKILLLLLLLPLLSGCYYDSEELLYTTTECATDGVTFSGTVVPILVENCFRCHDAANNFGGITLEGYDQVKRFADSGQLVGAISHTAGFSAMPKNAPQLVECNIEKIAAWVDAGAPNN